MKKDKKIEILIVDDTADIISQVQQILIASGYEVFVATSGEKALQRLQLHKPDLILLDIIMPGIDGYETCLKIKSDPAQSGIPVIFMSALHETFDKVKAFGTGAVDYITKPLNPEELLARIKTHLSISQLQLELKAANSQLEEKIEIRTKELRESEKKYKHLFEKSQEGIWVIDKDDKTSMVNPAMCQMLGYSESEMIGKDIYHFMDEKGKRAGRIKVLQRKKGMSEQHDFELIRKDGKQIFITMETGPLFDEEGNYSGAIAGVIDITDRKLAEKNLIEKNEEYEALNEELRQTNEELIISKEATDNAARLIQNITDNIPAFVSVLDAETLIYKFANNRFCKAFRKSKEEIVGKKYIDIVGNANASYAMEYLNEVKKGKPVTYVNVFNFSDESLHIQVNYVPIFTEQGKIKEILVLGNDITGLKESEAELIKAKEKAEEGEKLKTAFLQNMSHEIRTPMNAIMGFSKLLDKAEISADKIKSYTNIILNSSNQLLSIVTDILTISSIETKQENLSIQPVCVNNIVVDLLSIFKMQAINQNISLYPKQELNDIQSTIYTDSTKLTQVLSNLITNALKFTHQGFVEFGYSLINNNLQFYVKDTGIGIDAEQKEKIFERFRQADLSINKKYGGTGLGLSISKGFVEQMGGKIWVESEPENGSIFYFTIPYNPVNKELDQNVLPKDKNKSILVAEDEEFNYLFIEEILLDFGFPIVHAKNGQEAIELCKANNNIALVLMDIKMPVMDGYTAASEIKKICPELPIIAQSAYALEHEIEKYYGESFVEYITKPIDENELVEKVKRFIDIGKHG